MNRDIEHISNTSVRIGEKGEWEIEIALEFPMLLY